MSGTFGTLTFDNGGIENLYSDTLTNADVSYATTIGDVSLTVAHNAADGASRCKFSISWIHCKRNGVHFNCRRSNWWNISKN